MIRIRCLVISILCLPLIQGIAQTPNRHFYQPPAWQPRAILPYEDAIRNDFWPASPDVRVDYNDPGFVDQRLSKIPPPGIYPRVLMTPADIDSIRSRLAMGERAPLSFRVMWERVANGRSAFYALVTRDEALGKTLAADLVAKAKTLIPKLDAMDRRPDRDNLWNVERSIVADGDPDPPTEIWDLLQYDYLHAWMNPDERKLVTEAIAKVCHKRISNFLHVPDHFMINNHEGFGMEYIRLFLLLEGQPGYDAALYKATVHKVRAMLDWFLDKDGMCYESIKGWLNISAFMAIGLRERDLLKHEHLRAKMRYFQAALRYEDGRWRIRDEMRASAFHVIWMMHYFHPADKGIDMLYRASFDTHPFLTDARVKWPDPVGIAQELALLFAVEGELKKEGRPIDWNQPKNVMSLGLPTVWHDSTRGYVEVRNSWHPGDLHVGFVCKQDFFYGGHEGSETNRITLWKDGVNWIRDNNMLADKATFLQNMLTVDGKGLKWPPAPGNWLGMQASEDGVTAAGDGKVSYSYSKVMQVHPFSFPSVRTPYLAPFAEPNTDLSRDIQIAFQPSTIRYNDGYAHTDYGPWSGETRLVEGYRSFNPMKQAYRTIHVGRGKFPYLLVFDDANKDDQVHRFDFNLSIPEDIVLVDAITPEIVFQQTDPSAIRSGDMILGKVDTPRDSATGKYLPRKGDPLCLIRILWRNTDYGFPVPQLGKMQGHALVTIPAISASPEFRVMVYPYKHGDPLPRTGWNSDRSVLEVAIGDQVDTVRLARTDGGRTAISVSRLGRPVLSSGVAPARPILQVSGESFEAADLRYTRMDGVPPVYPFMDTIRVGLKMPRSPARIHYTLDGSDPNASSPRFPGRIQISRSATLKARVIDPSWTQGDSSGQVLIAQFRKESAAKPVENPVSALRTGLTAEIFEIDTRMWDDRGFFRANLSMMPDLKGYTPVGRWSMPGLILPRTAPASSFLEQRKGFYRFTGFFYAASTGVHRFRLHSTGPVTLDIGGRAVIESVGIFHQQEEDRNGAVVLSKGWHRFELVICDPLFWNVNSLPELPLRLSFAMGDDALSEVPAARFRTVPGTEMRAMRRIPAVTPGFLLEPGMDMKLYERPNGRRRPDFLDIDTALPFRQEMVRRMEAANQRNMVRAYDGFIEATEDGVYQFDMPFREGENAWLGSIQASCQSQLRIAGEVILQRGVAGRNPDGKVWLQKGWHAISLRFGTGSATCKMKGPDGQVIDIDGFSVHRPARVVFEADGKPLTGVSLEGFHSQTLRMYFPLRPDAEIRYTLDGVQPGPGSAISSGWIRLAGDALITATPFVNGKPLGAPSVLVFKRVQTPQHGLLGSYRFASDNRLGMQDSVIRRFEVWHAPQTTLRKDLHDEWIDMPRVAASQLPVDINVSRAGGPKPGFKLHGIRMRENALSVALWFNVPEATGKLFGKDGINAFGKSYRTVSCQLNNGRLSAMSGRLSGGTVTPGRWHFLVLTADEAQSALYLDGKQVARGTGSRDILTDALDFFQGTAARARAFSLYDRRLDDQEVARLHEMGAEIKNEPTTLSLPDPVRLEVRNPGKDTLTDIILRVPMATGSGVFQEGLYPRLTDVNGAGIDAQVSTVDAVNISPVLYWKASLLPGQVCSYRLSWSTKPPEKPFQVSIALERRNALNTPLGRVLSDTFLPAMLPARTGFQPYRTDGPFWENERIAFRHYLDGRNAKDVFGKRSHGLMPDSVGRTAANGVVDNYHVLAGWGRDVLPVGDAVGLSLGLGGIGIEIGGKPYRIGGMASDTIHNVARTITRIVEQGPLMAGLEMTHEGWVPVSGRSITLMEHPLIFSGAYAYQNTVSASGLQPDDRMLIGLPKVASGTALRMHHIGDRLLVYTYDRQTYLREFLLGMALLIPASSFDGVMMAPTTGSVAHSHLLRLKLRDGEPLTYQAIAGWELSDQRFLSETGFLAYLRTFTRGLTTDVPIRIIKE